MVSCVEGTGTCWFSRVYWAMDYSVGVDVVCLSASRPLALFTLLMGLPSLQLNMDARFIMRGAMTEQLLLLLFLLARLSDIPASVICNFKEQIFLQLQTVSHYYFLSE